MIALLGRPDSPTDGIEDYCIYLGQALARRDVTLARVHALWNEEGWMRALRRLWRESAKWRGEWVLLQYTALAWSRRGFPMGVLIVAAMLRRRGARCAVVFHENTGYGGSSWRERIRNACQMWVLRTIYRKSARSIFTAPLETIGWLPTVRAEHLHTVVNNRAVFIPIGANIPECLDIRSQPSSSAREKRVIVFGVRDAPAAGEEVADIAAAARGASRAIPNLRLIVLGRGASDARDLFARALEGSLVGLEIRGITPADEITREFRRADALLFVRTAISLQRGTVLAGIACGLPIVGYGSGEPCGPIAEAGVEWAPWHDPMALAHALVRVLSDSERWTELHECNVRVHERYLSWNRIAELFTETLAI